jgi:signal transduction histidine kinase
MSRTLPCLLDGKAARAAFVRLHGASVQVTHFFASDASHELRTPLTSIKSVGEVALRRSKARPRGNLQNGRTEENGRASSSEKTSKPASRKATE